MRLGNEILCGYLQYWNYKVKSVGHVYHVATTEHYWQFISRAQHEKSSRRLGGQGNSLDHKRMSVFHSNIPFHCPFHSTVPDSSVPQVALAQATGRKKCIYILETCGNMAYKL